MNRRFTFLFFVAVCVALLPFRSPAPLIYMPGEGWYYEPAGSNAEWARTRAKDQLAVAEEAFKDKDYSTALHAAYRILKIWPLSDYAPRAEYLIGRCLEANGRDEAAFNAYQNLMKKPRSETMPGNFLRNLRCQFGRDGFDVRLLSGDKLHVDGMTNQKRQARDGRDPD